MKNRFLNFEHHSWKIGFSGFLLLTVSCVLNGCGSETYEQRLKETAKYFEYVDIRNQALANSWSAPTVSLRTPAEFKQINAPIPESTTDSEDPNSEEAEAVDPEPTQTVDPRQPDYVDLVLPGLEGAWRVEVPVEMENDTEDHPAYLYVLSNHYLLKEKLTDEALGFHDEINNQIAGAFNHALNIEEFTTEKYPQEKGYSVPKSYLVGSFEPETEINGVPYQIKLYLAEAGDNKVALLLVIPKNVSGRAKLSDHMDFSLETVEIVSPRGGGRNNSSSGSNKF